MLQLNDLILIKTLLHAHNILYCICHINNYYCTTLNTNTYYVIFLLVLLTAM